MVATSQSGAHAQEPSIERFGVYVVVSDLDRAQQFYERLFQKAPSLRNDSIVAFDVAGGLFVAFSASGLDRSLIRGDNAAPYLRVKDIEAEFTRVKGIAAKVLDPNVVREGPISLFRFADPDGNLLEFFAFNAP